MKVEQLSIFIENKPGRLAEVATALAKNNINIRALSLADTMEYGVLRLIVDRPEDGRRALSEQGFSAQVTEVLAVEVPDRPGGLGEILIAFQAAGVSVEYMYAFFSHQQAVAIMIFRVDDLDRGLSAIKPGIGRIIPRAELYQQ
ncbi:MAG: ACT domain-containing protein [Candidatus Adiutrix sp.]|jgi:hypothetical protein|nr:ACT domain-containing protein [Candidatus Adiutrix sp.]